MACNVLISQKNGWPMKALGSPWAAPALESLFNKAKHRIEKEVTQDFLPKETNGFGLPAKSMAVYKLAEEEETYVITFRATGCLSDWATDVAMIQQVVSNFGWWELGLNMLTAAGDTVKRVLCGVDLTSRRSQLAQNTSLKPMKSRRLHRKYAVRDMSLSRLERTVASAEYITSQRPSANWIFTGWSLGGALALHCAQMFDRTSVAFAPLITSPILLQHPGNIIVNDIDDMVYRVYCFRVKPGVDHCRHVKCVAGNAPFNHMLADLFFALQDSAVMPSSKAGGDSDSSSWKMLQQRMLHGGSMQESVAKKGEDVASSRKGIVTTGSRKVSFFPNGD